MPYIPLLQNILRDKEITLQHLFDLEPIPTDIKYLKPSNKYFSEIRNEIKSSNTDLKYATNCCERDELNNALSYIDNVDTSIRNIDDATDELEKIDSQWEDAYLSLLEFTKILINKENIDISKYTSCLSDAEYLSYTRITKINNLLK